jgi:hypothetical protein
MVWLVASFLLLIWLASLAFKVTAGAIHLLLLAAVAMFIWGFLKGRGARTTV